MGRSLHSRTLILVLNSDGALTGRDDRDRYSSRYDDYPRGGGRYDDYPPRRDDYCAQQFGHHSRIMPC